MRVVAGSAKGRRLVAPGGDHTRPTADRVREAIFNSLGGLIELDGAMVVDLFAGTGALGIEALSRGAAHATFVDHDRHARRAIAANLAATQLAHLATVRGGEALALLAGLDSTPACRIESTSNRADGMAFDLAFCDPPYRFDRWSELLAALRAGLGVLESDRDLDLPPPWRLVRSKRYGSTVISFATQE